MEPLTTRPAREAEPRSRWSSLSPDRRYARDPGQIGAVLAERGVATRIVRAVEAGLGEIEASIHAAFPDNLFADLDKLAAGIAREAAAGPEPLAHIARATDTTVTLMHLFGCGTTIRFRYVHDFIYGFDWAKWVRKDPGARAEVGPFDQAFLSRMVGRGHELLALIEANDAKYPRLPGEGARNPFGFSREPEDERALFTDLAVRGLLPVAAWDCDASAVWDRPFAELRRERAVALALGVAR